jgi:SSS family solute:Na+ symporter
VAGIATVLALLAPDMLVTLLLIGYSGVAQLVPAIAFGLFWRRATLPGVAWGVALGILVAILVQVTAWQPPWGLHAGFIGLTLNLAVTVAISLITSPPEASRLRRVEQLLGADEPTAS